MPNPVREWAERNTVLPELIDDLLTHSPFMRMLDRRALNADARRINDAVDAMRCAIAATDIANGATVYSYTTAGHDNVVSASDLVALLSHDPAGDHIAHINSLCGRAVEGLDARERARRYLANCETLERRPSKAELFRAKCGRPIKFKRLKLTDGYGNPVIRLLPL